MAPEMEQIIISSIGIAIFGLVDLLVWGLAIYLWGRRFIFLRRAVTIEGKCIGVRRTRAGESGVGHYVYHPIVRWQDRDGSLHEVGCTRGSEMWDDMVGTPLDVLVIPGRPETALVELDRFNAPTVVIILAVAFALPWVLCALVLVASLRAAGVL